MRSTLAPPAADLQAPQDWQHPALDDLLVQAFDRVVAAEPTNIGFPRATDVDYRGLSAFLGIMLNNVGHPRSGSIYPAHVKDVECRVLDYFAALVSAPAGWDGYVTTGGTEGTLYGLAAARAVHPTAIAYVSAAAHYSVTKCCDLLGLPYVLVPAAPHGEIDYVGLRQAAAGHRDRPAVAVCTVGTTMSEAVDNVPRVRQALAAAGVRETWVHADAAMAGPHLALSGRTDFGLGARGGSDSLSISGHKWYGTPIPSGIALTRRPQRKPSRLVDYIGARDGTITGSRSGLAAVMIWHALSQIARRGPDAHRLRAERARAVAGYAQARLADIGWPCWRNPHAITVMLQPLPAALQQRWPLPSDGGWAHLIAMPGTPTSTIDRLMDDLKELM